MSEFSPAGEPPAQLTIETVSLSWFLRRALMAVVILGVTIGSGAWLLHASIDTSAEAIAPGLEAGPGRASGVSTSSIP